MAIHDGLEEISINQTITANTYAQYAKFNPGKSDFGALCPKPTLNFVVKGAFENALTIRVLGFSDADEFSDEFTIIERTYEASDLTKGAVFWIEIPAVNRLYKHFRVGYILDGSSDDLADADLPECPAMPVVDTTNYDANTICCTLTYGRTDAFANELHVNYISADLG